MIVNMQTVTMNSRQSKELADEIGKLLAVQLDSEAIQNKINRIVSDYVKRNSISDDASDIAKKVSWSVKVTMKGY